MAVVFKSISAVLLMALGYLGFGSSFKPPGRYDLGPADLNALCPMIKEFSETGLAPKPATIKEPKTSPHGCVYFKWVTCTEGESDPLKPCGWYEMKKCNGGERSAAGFEPSDQLDSQEEHREKRSKVLEELPEGSHTSPVVIDFVPSRMV